MATWTTSEPTTTTEIGSGLTYIRENWEVIENAWNVEHTTLSGTGTTSGAHVIVTLKNSGTATATADASVLYSADVGSKAEVYIKHEDDEDIQLTATNGTNYGLSGRQFVLLSSNDFNVTMGTTDGTTGIRVRNSSGTSQILIDSKGRINMIQTTAPTVTTGGALYVDTSNSLHYVNSTSNTTIINTSASDAQPGHYIVGNIYTAWATRSVPGETTASLTLSVKLTTVYSVSVGAVLSGTISKYVYCYRVNNTGSKTVIEVYNSNASAVTGYVTVIGKL